ncbi:MAG TPA: hypothetical protein VF498_16865 [Anaerolineales bacterium]
MPFDWLNDFHRSMEKPDNYAEKTLAAYRLGMKAGGPIRGVSIRVGSNSCQAARALPEGEIYHPDEAPHLPLPDCPLGRRCQCAYRPVMTYQEKE